MSSLNGVSKVSVQLPQFPKTENQGPGSLLYCKSTDREGNTLHELFRTTGNIDIGKVNSYQDAEHHFYNGDTFTTGGKDPNQPKFYEIA